jgi:TonB family protein
VLANNRITRSFGGRSRGRLRIFNLVVLLLGLTFVQVLPAQEQEIARKVIAKTAPSYPEMAKKMHLGGKVKLEVLVTASGSVASAKLIGGSPVFEKSAVEAVKQWRFQPAEKDTRGIIILEFATQQ